MRTLPPCFPAVGLILGASALLTFSCDSGSSAFEENGSTGGTTSVPGDGNGNDNGDGTGDGGRGGAGGASFAGVAPCISDKDCTTAGQLCDFERHVCAECLEDSDCENGVCELGTCLPVTTCTNSLNCGGDEVCDDGICVGCITEADCDDGQMCHDGQCATSCDSDKDCTGSGMLCDTASDICVECLDGADCGDGNACVNGSCKPAACEAGTGRCFSSGAVICRPDGLGYLDPVECEDCSLEGGEPQCGDDPLQGTGSNLLPGGTFGMGPGNWRLSGGADGAPNVESGAACQSVEGAFTLGWPGEGAGLDLPAGSYTFTFDLDVAEGDGNTYGSVEAKVSGADEPYEPQLFSETLDELEGTSESYEFGFTVDEDASNIGVAFNVSGLADGICIDNIRLRAN